MSLGQTVVPMHMTRHYAMPETARLQPSSFAIHKYGHVDCPGCGCRPDYTSPVISKQFESAYSAQQDEMRGYARSSSHPARHNQFYKLASRVTPLLRLLGPPQTQGQLCKTLFPC